MRVKEELSMKKKWLCLFTALALIVGVCAAAPMSGEAVSLERKKYRDVTAILMCFRALTRIWKRQRAFSQSWNSRGTVRPKKVIRIEQMEN